MSVSDDLVLCTRNRPREVESCLESVVRQHRLPTQVTVVDSSDDTATRALVEARRATWPEGSRLEYRHSEPGLTRQRAVGVAVTTHDVVHFLDDDTVLEPGYFAGIMATFAADPTGRLGGVGGFITNQPPHRWRRIDEVLLLDSRHEGVVLASGRNVRVSVEPADDLDVDWLPGAAMSYRRAVLERHPLNPDAAFHSEDVELSYRVRQEYRLVVTPRARLRHDEVPHGRLRGAPLVERELRARWERIRSGIGRYSRTAFWWSVAGQLVRYGIPAALTGRDERREIVIGTWRGLRGVLRDR